MSAVNSDRATIAMNARLFLMLNSSNVGKVANQVRIAEEQRLYGDPRHSKTKWRCEMRVMFSLLSLVIVLGVVGLLANKQHASLHSPDPVAANNAGVVVPATAPGATPAQQSQQIQAQVKANLDAALQQSHPMPDDR